MENFGTFVSHTKFLTKSILTTNQLQIKFGKQKKSKKEVLKVLEVLEVRLLKAIHKEYYSMKVLALLHL